MSSNVLRAAAARPFLREVKTLAPLALPLVLGQLFGIGTEVILSFFAGHMGADTMAAVALGGSFWIVIFMAVLGLMMSVQPAVSALHGAERQHETGHLLAQAILLGLGAGSLGGLILAIAGPVIAGGMGLPPEALPGIRRFLHASAWSIPALGVLASCRGLSEGLSMTRPTMVVGAIGLLVLVPAALVLMPGAVVPELGHIGGFGAAGGGIALALVLWLEALAYLGWITLSGRYPMVVWSRSAIRPDPAVLRRFIRVGTPIAITTVLEVCMFSVATLMAGHFGAVAVAGHQVALMTTAVFFMTPLGLSLAVTVRVGRAVGGGDWEGVRLAGLAGFALMAVSQSISCSLMLMAAGPIASLFTQVPAVQALAITLLHLAAVFQFMDGTQVVAMGALRGQEDTRMPMLLAMLAYWLVGVPGGGILAFALGLGVVGVWVGLMGGLTLAAFLLAGRVLWLSGPARRA
ncbi:MAG TPA: MATE family efflux transporter [Acidisoma sp.]|uniref:MATE family efflux transporter n=1 Tax=Acidisoma sp. TaxID=1872115 RepID=UPI002D00C237|nr:MATE family efflux transporter [Acidisoma sp.]HTI02812.1 MATE family efflux transporter [Acidisoma sp.]